jgi:hypothetical protein
MVQLRRNDSPFDDLRDGANSGEIAHRFDLRDEASKWLNDGITDAQPASLFDLRDVASRNRHTRNRGGRATHLQIHFRRFV